MISVQGAFRQVAVEADACAKELTQILKQRMVTQKDEAAECIQMVRKLGEPIESLQVHPLPCLLTFGSPLSCFLKQGLVLTRLLCLALQRHDNQALLLGAMFVEIVSTKLLPGI